MKKYRVAVVGGAGTWGSRYLHAYATHPACEIIALVDRAKDRRQTFADRYGIKAVFDSLDDLLGSYASYLPFFLWYMKKKGR